MTNKKVKLVKVPAEYKGKKVNAMLLVVDGKAIEVNDIDDIMSVYDHRPQTSPGKEG